MIVLQVIVAVVVVFVAFAFWIANAAFNDMKQIYNRRQQDFEEFEYDDVAGVSIGHHITKEEK